MSFNKTIHFIKGFNPSLPNNIQATILSQHLIIQIQHRNVNCIGAKRSRKHQQNPAPTIRTGEKMRHGGHLGNEVPNRQPHRVPTHETLVPRETIECGVKSNEDGISEERKKRVGEARDRVGFVDDNVGAASELGSDAGGERDVAAGADNNVGLEVSEVAEALDQRLEETVREEEKVLGW